jgi:hypothetical protein
LSVQDQYKLPDLVNRPVIRDEMTNTYYVFESRKEFFTWYEDRPEKDRCCHEVVFGKLAQRLKFDVDAPTHMLDALPDGTLEAALLAATDNLSDGASVSRAEDLDEYLIELLGASEDPPPPTAEAIRTKKIHAIVGLLIDAILDELYVAYYGIEDLLPTRVDVVVTDSSGPTVNGTKYSFVADNEEAREFTARVLERLPPPARGH